MRDFLCPPFPILFLWRKPAHVLEVHRPKLTHQYVATGYPPAAERAPRMIIQESFH
jgi:hypothetical protein